MKILRRIPIAIAFISAMVTVASYRALASDVTIIEATPDELVIRLSMIPNPSGQHGGRHPFEEAERLGAEHCKKFGLFTGRIIISVNSTLISGEIFGVATVPCDTKKYKRKTREELRADDIREALSLRDKPDRDLCTSLSYGNPDFAKEAERRELTEKKCKEILGQ